MVDSHRALAKAGGPVSVVVNLSNEYEITIRTPTEAILETSDNDSGVTHEPLPEDDPECRRSDLFAGALKVELRTERGVARRPQTDGRLLQLRAQL
jgi:hypothetical protein